MNNIVNKVGKGDNKVSGAKSMVMAQKNNKSAKFKNLVQPDFSLVKSIKPSSRSRFFNLVARLTFAKLKHMFIKTLVLYHFNSEYNI